MLLALCVMISVLVASVVLMPFFMGEGGKLQAAASVDDPDQLQAMQKAVLRRYLDDEEAWKKKLISPRVWRARQQFLVNRYIDTTRRLDYVLSLQPQRKES